MRREAMMAQADESGYRDRIIFLGDVDDDEKRLLMANAVAYALPSKPMPEFVETFGIALVEKMLAGGGPIITTRTGGIPEAVGDTALIVNPGSPKDIAAALDTAVLHTDAADRAHAEMAAQAYAMQFDRLAVFDRLFAGLDATSPTPLVDLDNPVPTAPVRPANPRLRRRPHAADPGQPVRLRYPWA